MLFCSILTLFLTSISLQYPKTSVLCYSPVPVPFQSRPSPVPKWQISPKNVKQGGKNPLCFTKYIGSNLTWDNAVLCWTDQSHVWQTSLIWDRQVSDGKSSLIWDIAISCDTGQSHMGQTSLIWDRPVSFGTDQSHMGQISLIWDIAVSYVI